MARFDGFPERRSDPLWRTRTYVDRRVGMADPAAQRWEERWRRRHAPRPAPAVQMAAGRPAAGAARQDRLYRSLRTEGGPPDAYWVKVRVAGQGLRMKRLATAFDPPPVVSDLAGVIAALRAAGIVA